MAQFFQTQYICDNLARRHPVLPILVESYSREFETNTYAHHTTSQFYMFVLYLVKTSYDFYGIPNTSSNIRDTALHSLRLVTTEFFILLT